MHETEIISNLILHTGYTSQEAIRCSIRCAEA